MPLRPLALVLLASSGAQMSDPKLDKLNRDYAQERAMFERSFGRPRNYRKLSPETRWAIDESLGILDWEGKYLTKADEVRLNEHYE